MEKICIVNLRKHLTNHPNGLRLFGQGERLDEPGIFKAPALSAARTRLVRDAQQSGGAAGDNGETAGGRVSLTLTPAQMRTLQTDPHLASLLYEKGHLLTGKVGHCDEGTTIQLELPSLPPVRLLKLDEVTRMLRIGRSSLRAILKEGTLKSYKLGRLRRVMLDDLLTYLESHRQWSPIEQRAAKAKRSPKGRRQPQAIKEE